MFFQDLMNLKKRQISTHDIEMLDWWLGTRKPNHRKYLNPLQFSIDCRIDVSHALNLFSICVLDKSIQLLSVRYVSRCAFCESILSQQSEYMDIKKVRKKCYECGSQNDERFLKENSEIFFTLLKQPDLNTTSLPAGLSLGKHQACKVLI